MTFSANRQFVIGCALGDGCLKTAEDGRSTTLYISRCARHEPYAQWQLDRLNRILGTHATLRHFSDKGKYPAVRFGVTSVYALRSVQELLYPGGAKEFRYSWLKELGPEALALFWMDDGSLEVRKRQRPRSVKIERIGWLATSHDAEQVEAIARWTHDVTGATPSMVTHRSGLVYLRWFSRQFRTFVSAIDEFVVPCMKYKVDLNRSGTVAEWFSESQRQQLAVDDKTA